MGRSLFSVKQIVTKFVWIPFLIIVWCFALLMQIYVVDSVDRERIGRAKEEFQVLFMKFSLIFAPNSPLIALAFSFAQAIIKDPSMLNAIILVFANKQDMVRKYHCP